MILLSLQQRVMSFSIIRGGEKIEGNWISTRPHGTQVMSQKTRGLSVPNYKQVSLHTILPETVAASSRAEG